MIKAAGAVFSGFMIASLAGICVLHSLFRPGEPYIDLTSEPVLPSSSLEVVASLDEPPGNIVVSRDNRIFFTLHPEARPQGFKLMELKEGHPVPFPDEAFQSRFITPLGLALDGQNRLWCIDHGKQGIKHARLFAFDMTLGTLVHEYEFPREIAPFGSFLNDLQVDFEGRHVFIADIGFLRRSPALIAYDVEKKSARRLLENHPSIKPQDWILRTRTKRMTFFHGLIALKAGVDGIALDSENEWLYFAAMNHDSVFRISVRDLLDTTVSSQQLGQKVEKVGPKPLSDGIGIAPDGRLYITDVEHGAIFRMTSGRNLETVMMDPKIRWPDGLGFGPDRFVYFTDSDLADVMMQSKSKIRANAPYFIYRFKPVYEQDLSATS